VFRLLAAVHIHPVEIVWSAFDARETHTHPPIGIRAAKPAAVAPSRVKMIVRPPGDRPQIAARRGGLMRFPMPGKILNDLARWVRRLGRRGFRALAVRREAGKQKPTKTSDSLGEYEAHFDSLVQLKGIKATISRSTQERK
jgi:hypothetical protein